MKNNKIIIKTDKELKIIMSPIRQKIIKLMRIEGKSVTSKHIADKLNISPSSARHHIKQLELLDIIKPDYSEVINGITANYLKLTDKTISLGQDINDDLSDERDILTRNMIYETYDGYQKLIKNYRDLLTDEFNKGNKIADVLSGVLHLTNEESNELYDIISNFIKAHSKSASNTHPFEYALIAYRSDLAGEQVEKLK
nr:helix-turn-helix domain-containing protein [Sedimentibacter sp.]